MIVVPAWERVNPIRVDIDAQMIPPGKRFKNGDIAKISPFRDNEVEIGGAYRQVQLVIKRSCPEFE